MTSQLQPNDLSVTAQFCRDCALALIDLRGRLQFDLQQLLATNSPLANINAKNQEISETNTRISQIASKAQDLDTKAILGILADTDVLNAINKITDAKTKVLKAVEKINDVRRVLKFVDLFIRIAGAIVSAVTTGNPAAQIKLILEAIDSL
jgi:hypothetical protein